MAIRILEDLVTEDNVTDNCESYQVGTGNVYNSSCQKKRDNFPTSAEIDINYPKPYHKDPPNCQDRNRDGSWKYENQCAIRMSIALSKCGIAFSTYTDPKCSHGHARGAKSLANWIWKKHLCPPKIYKENDAKNIRSLISSKTGIIFFHNLSGERDNDHIDLYYNDATQSDYTNLWTATEYWFFQLNER